MATPPNDDVYYVDSGMGPKTFATFGILGCSVGSYLIAETLLSKTKEDKAIKYRGFVLGCTVFAIGLNFASYYYYPYKRVNYGIRIDPVRRAGLWSLYGGVIGIFLGRLIFQLPLNLRGD
eukprot:240692_1